MKIETRNNYPILVACNSGVIEFDPIKDVPSESWRELTFQEEQNYPGLEYMPRIATLYLDGGKGKVLLTFHMTTDGPSFGLDLTVEQAKDFMDYETDNELAEIICFAYTMDDGWEEVATI